MKIFSCILIAALAGAPLAFGVETQSWVHNDQSEFEKGTLKNLSLRSDGRLTLAPQFRELADPSIAYLWALAVDSKGTLYAGGGGPGAAASKLIAVDVSGKSRTVAELQGLQIQAIAVDKQDRVYAATAPAGKVYRVDAAGKAEIFYDPHANYIWALAFNRAGDLFVATGDAGEIHRVTPDGRGSVFFRTEETHARSLAIDSKDNLIVGTEPGGLILRVSPSGAGFVLYQASKREVTSVAVAKDGSLYAAAVGNKTGSKPPAPPVPVPAPVAAPAAPAARPAAPATPAPAPPPSSLPTSVAGGSEVYRIGSDNYPQQVWSHPTDIVYAIAFDNEGRPVLGTGNRGNIYRVNSGLVSTLLVNAAPTQITALASGPGGRLFAATGNVGKVFALGPGLETSGTYESPSLDVGFFSYWGRASAKADLNGGQVRIDTRSGNLDRPQNNWSQWAPPDAQGRVTSPSARFLQYRVTLQAGTSGKSPEIREIEVAYKTRNVAPELEKIDITPANYRFNPPAAAAVEPTTITLPSLSAPQRVTPVLRIESSSANTMLYAKNHTGARWAAADPNGDEMQYKVEIRGLQEENWKLLRDKVKENFISWDSSAFPDGEYQLRVTASDAPDNPPDQALITTLESDRFTIDNTPPRISGLAGTRSGRKLEFRWSARDDRSNIQKAEYSLNGGNWTPVEPITRLSDAPELQYTLGLDAPEGETTLAVRITDEYDNQSVEKVTLH
jgi:sugar lactone lactonase YvrE